MEKIVRLKLMIKKERSILFQTGSKNQNKRRFERVKSRGSKKDTETEKTGEKDLKD